MPRSALLVIFGVSVLAPVTSAAQIGQADAQALQRMVATERAFAAATAEVGVRDGFLAFFAEDSVQIQRGDAVTLSPARDALASQALQKLPLVNQLLWEPFTGHVSSDGTLGWLTGAYVVFNQAQKTPIGQGAYFSVWKRQANGTWRVWLDEGIRFPQIWQNASPFRVAPDPDPGKGGAPNETIAEAERALTADAAHAGFAERLSAHARFHRDGQMPVVGREAIVEWMRANRSPSACRVLQTESAASGDLAVVIGACAPAKGKPASYVRVWKRDVTGTWRIVFQTENGS